MKVFYELANYIGFFAEGQISEKNPKTKPLKSSTVGNRNMTPSQSKRMAEIVVISFERNVFLNSDIVEIANQTVSKFPE